MATVQKKILKRSDDKMIAGVCAGIAEWLGWLSPNRVGIAYSYRNSLFGAIPFPAGKTSRDLVTLKKVQQLTNVPENGLHHIYWVDAKVIEDFRPDKLK